MMNVAMMRQMMHGVSSTAPKAKDDIMGLVKEKLETLGYFPVYITPDLEHRIRDLQSEELESRKTKQFSIEKGVRMLKEIDDINDELNKLKIEYRKEKLKEEMEKQKEESESDQMRRKRKSKQKIKRKIVLKKPKKIIKKRK